MTMEFKEASKKNIRLKALISGLSGSGKTLSSLLLLKGLSSKVENIGLIQTEPGRAQLYKDKIGAFKVLEIPPPFTPAKFMEAIEVAEKSGLTAICIDSLSDEWAGLGGCLDMHNDATITVKNSFTAWKAVTPKHEALFNRIMASPIHIVCTLKKKADYVMETNDRGKQQPKKVGLADIAREGTDYKFMLQLEVDRETHMAVAVKDNTSLMDGKPPFLITEDTGLMIRDWCLKEG